MHQRHCTAHQTQQQPSSTLYAPASQVLSATSRSARGHSLAPNTNNNRRAPLHAAREGQTRNWALPQTGCSPAPLISRAPQRAKAPQALHPDKTEQKNLKSRQAGRRVKTDRIHHQTRTPIQTAPKQTAHSTQPQTTPTQKVNRASNRLRHQQNNTECSTLQWAQSRKARTQRATNQPSAKHHPSIHHSPSRHRSRSARPRRQGSMKKILTTPPPCTLAGPTRHTQHTRGGG
jgi:hypothetical protein